MKRPLASDGDERSSDCAQPDVALCVDLDGTLIRSDVLVEGWLRCVKLDVWNALRSVGWLLRGIGHLKAEIARRVPLDPVHLPVNDDVLAWLQTEYENGRRLVLCTAANSIDAHSIARHFGIFESVICSDPSRNLSGTAKAAALEERFGVGGFDYAGNESKDLHVWARARSAIVVAPTAGLRRRLDQVPRLARIFDKGRPPLRLWLRAMRLHQWAKNVLVFVPALASHRIVEPPVAGAALLAFVWFGVCASATYLINDLLDLQDDRRHRWKRTRPFAAGQLSLMQGAVAACLFLVVAFTGGALTLGPLFVACLAGYVVTTLWYSFSLKRIAMVDVLTLSGLYTLRILAGSAAVGIGPSFWLLVFSTFTFLSLGVAKRYAELETARLTASAVAAGRGYATGDLQLLLIIGTSAGLVSVLILALYINMGTGDLYPRHEALWLLCPLWLYWICHIWFKTHRGEMHEDPVIFALRDRPSLVVGLLSGLLIWLATSPVTFLAR